MGEIYDKFLVIKMEDIHKYLTQKDIDKLDSILSIIQRGRVTDGNKSDNDYLVVNRDEEYASEVEKLILDNDGAH